MSRLTFAALALSLGATPFFQPSQSVVPGEARDLQLVRADLAQDELPFGVGEKILYQVEAKALVTIAKGTGEMEVSGIDTIRGRETLRIGFGVRGKALGLEINDRYESWLDPKTLSSLRYREDKHEMSYKKKRTFEIFPETRTYVEDSQPPRPSVAQPLDDGSFLYFIRTVPLVIGQTYTYDRYFRLDRNPVTITVVKRDSISVAGRKWDAILIRPTISTGDKGLLSKDSKPEIWLSADKSRIILQMKSRLTYGSSLTLTLKSYCPATSARTGRPCI